MTKQSAVSGGSGELFERQEIAIELLSSDPMPKYKEIAERCGSSESTLREWRKQRRFCNRVTEKRQEKRDARLAKYFALAELVDAELFSIITDKGLAPTARVGAIREFRDCLNQLLSDATGDADRADFEAMNDKFENQFGTQRR